MAAAAPVTPDVVDAAIVCAYPDDDIIPSKHGTDDQPNLSTN